jgi:DNA polymerase III epsilon subunit-like protein
MEYACEHDEFVAVDVETASRLPPRICAIGATRFEGGIETGAFQSLVAFRGQVRFTRVHRLTAAALAGAPQWTDVWPAFAAFLGETKRVVAFRASFDRAALLSMCALYGIRMPRLQFVCAAEIAHLRLGRNLSLHASLLALGIPFPGRPHDPLADARAAAALMLACR